MQSANNNTEDSFHNEKTIKSNSLNWILFLLVIYTLHFAQTLLIPLVFTALIALMLNPIVSLLKRFMIPRTVSAIMLLTLLIAPFTILSMNLVEPVQRWAKLVPELTAEITQQIETVTEEFEKSQKPVVEMTKKEKKGFFSWFDDDEEDEVPVKSNDENVVTAKIKQGGIDVLTSILLATPVLITQIVTSLILILFLLIFSPHLYQALVDGLNNYVEKEKATRVVESTQKQLSRFILTASVINFCLGLATSVGLYLVGLEDAILWGSLVALLNFIPYVGMVLGMCIICLAATVQFGFTLTIFAPLGIYAGLNLLESQIITPLVMGKNMLLNPLIVVIWLLACGWLWGIVGVLIAVPVLVCIKILLFELGIWKNWLKVIEAGS